MAGPLPLPVDSLSSPDTRALVQSLEAFVGRASRLRTAISEAQAALVGLEQELLALRGQEDTAEAAARQLRDELQRSEAQLRQVETDRRAVTRYPSPPPRTLPGTERGYAQEAVRAQSELTQRIGGQRRQLHLAQRTSAEARRAASAKGEEVERQHETLGGLHGELAQVPAEPEFAAALAAASRDGDEGPRPSGFALADIPPEYQDLYRRAARTCPGLSWTVLAAIGSAETAHGRSSLPGVRSGANSAGAMGPMQFLAETWTAYGKDADGDGVADVYHPADAVFGAAHYLCASGAGDRSRLAEAIWAYNHADWYVVAVLSRAAAYGTAGLGTAAADVASLVDHPGFSASAGAKADLLAGEVDPRVLAALAAAVAEHSIEVSVIETGHSQFVRGTDRVSNHYHGRAVDIASVDGQAVSTSNQGALRLALALLTADASLRPDELGSPWPELSRFPGAFADADHVDHLHLGWRSADQPRVAGG